MAVQLTSMLPSAKRPYASCATRSIPSLSVRRCSIESVIIRGELTVRRPGQRDRAAC